MSENLPPANEDPHCMSCGRLTTARDYCYGCKQRVCLKCVQRYGHDAWGEHGRSPVRLVDLQKIVDNLPPSDTLAP